MGEQQHVKFPQEVIDEYAALGVDLPALFSAGHLGNRMGVQILEASAERVVGVMPVEGNTQPYGLLHGGASAVLAETLGSVGSMLHGGVSKIAVGVDLNCTHHRGVRSGLVTGVATPVHRGRSTATYEIVITDEQDKRVCTARLTCLLREVGPRGERVRVRVRGPGGSGREGPLGPVRPVTSELSPGERQPWWPAPTSCWRRRSCG